MDIITREEWGSRHGAGVGRARSPASEVWLHHSVTVAPDTVPPWSDDYDAIRALERVGAERFGSAYGFPYTFAVTPAGLVFEGHDVRRMGAHTYRHNSVGRGIVLVGNYERDEPTEPQLDAVAALLRHGHAAGWWVKPRLTGGHRDVRATACPGRYAYARIDDINRRAEEDDMPSADEVAEAVWTHWIHNRRLKREEYSETLLGSLEDRIIRQQIAPLRGQVAGLSELVKQLADRTDLDLDAVERAAEAGTRRALEEGTVDVDVTVADGHQEKQG